MKTIHLLSFGRRATFRHARGFTLLELLVVIVIIGLLTAIVGPRYFSQIGKSEQGAARAQIEAFSRALDAYRLDTGHYPSTEQGFNYGDQLPITVTVYLTPKIILLRSALSWYQ